MVLTSPSLRVQLEPAWGAGLVRFDWIANGACVPLMRAYEPDMSSSGVPDPNRLACYPLVPWSNRISGEGFFFDGARIEVRRNREDEPWPIHGTGWQRAWQVESCSASAARLMLDETGSGPYRYHATLHYTVRDNVFDVALGATNIGDTALPFGLGLHPFFPRYDGVVLTAPASSVWLNDGHTPLPVEKTALPPVWNFAHEADLPEGVNHGFEGWTGRAVIRWPHRSLRLELAADVDRYVVYTPAQGDFFCFEPVDHGIDAVNGPGGALANGMTLLTPGASLQRRFSFRVFSEP
jgi:aldose 1-epimerase